MVRIVAESFRSMSCGWAWKDSTYRARGSGGLRGSSRRWWQQLWWLQVLSDVYDLGAPLQRTLLLQKEVVYSPAGAGRVFFIREHLWWVLEVNAAKSVHISALVCHLHHTGSSAKYIFKKSRAGCFMSSSPVSILLLERAFIYKAVCTHPLPPPLRNQKPLRQGQVSKWTKHNEIVNVQWLMRVYSPWCRHGRQVWTYL